MGRSTTPTFVVNYRTQGGLQTAIWNAKTSGEPTNENLETWRRSVNQSFQVGGANEHVAKTLGYLPHISEARIRNQKTGNLNVAYTKAPMFEVI